MPPRAGVVRAECRRGRPHCAARRHRNLFASCRRCLFLFGCDGCGRCGQCSVPLVPGGHFAANPPRPMVWLDIRISPHRVPAAKTVWRHGAKSRVAPLFPTGECRRSSRRGARRRSRRGADNPTGHVIPPGVDPPRPPCPGSRGVPHPFWRHGSRVRGITRHR